MAQATNFLGTFLLTFAIFQCILHKTEAAHAYFIENSDCSAYYSCTGETIDVTVICRNSKCICDPRLGIYDIQRYQCVGIANGACLGDTCTRNAFCDSETHTCNCTPGYEVSVDGRCVHKFNETCDENEDCKSGLGCFDGLCECRFPSHEYYNAENETCYSVAHSWDLHFKRIQNVGSQEHNNNSSTSTETNKASQILFNCLETLLSFVELGFLIFIASLLWRIGMLIKEIAGSFRVRGYFLRSDSSGRGHDKPMNAALIDAIV